MDPYSARFFLGIDLGYNGLNGLKGGYCQFNKQALLVHQVLPVQQARRRCLASIRPIRVCLPERRHASFPSYVMIKEHYRREDNLTELSNITVPVNNLGLTSGSFQPSTFSIEWTYAQARYFAFGGGPPLEYDGLPSNRSDFPSELFEGRRIGGGNRNGIYGSARWGSGMGETMLGSNGVYYWEPDYSLAVGDPEYSFGFWPIYWGRNGPSLSQLYGSTTQRPGGEQYLIILDVSSDNPAYYFMIADFQTANHIQNLLLLPVTQGGCGIYTFPLYYFTPDNVNQDANATHQLSPWIGTTPLSNVTIVPSNILQYYRSSSVALGNTRYFNTYTNGADYGPEYWGRSPFDLNSRNNSNNTNNQPFNLTAEQDFLTCLNHTIAAAIPIIDPSLTKSPPKKTSLSTGAILGISFGCLVAVIIIGYFIHAQLYRKWKANQRRVPLGRHTGGRRVTVTNHSGYNAPPSPRSPRTSDDYAHLEPLEGELPPLYNAEMTPKRVLEGR